MGRDSKDAICPYCGNRYQVESEDYSHDPRTEDCEECGKEYLIWQEFSVDTCTAAMEGEQP